MSRKALVVAGGQWQVPLICKLQSKGYSVTVVDPYDTSKGVAIADKHLKYDVRDKIAIGAGINEHFDVVATDQSDVSVDTVAYLATKFGVAGNEEFAVNRFSNKLVSRRYSESIGMPVPKFTRVRTVEEVLAFRSSVGGPLILKPCDAQSSKGIHKIDMEMPNESIEKALADALFYSFEKTCILEQFLVGYEITVEGFCSNGKHRVLACSRKEHFKTGIASSLKYPGNVPPRLLERIFEADDRYVENSGLKFGPTHAEYIVNEDLNEFYLVEIACRGGGTLISSDIVKWVSGIDVYEAYIACLEGNAVDVKSIVPLKRNAELHFFDFGDGEIVSLDGIESARKLKGVHALDFNYKVGDVLHGCQDDRSRQGFVIAFAESEQELDLLVSRVERMINVKLKHD